MNLYVELMQKIVIFALEARIKWFSDHGRRIGF